MWKENIYTKELQSFMVFTCRNIKHYTVNQDMKRLIYDFELVHT
jgi:hypothetical protein